MNKLEGALSPVPDELKDVVAILPIASTNNSTTVRWTDLSRELCRQSLWLVAREEFGLHVLDPALGDKIPATLPPDRILKYGPISAELPLTWELLAGSESIWTNNRPEANGIAIYQGTDILLKILHNISEQQLQKALAAARFPHKPNKRTDAAIPKDVERLLGELRETSQFAAVRRLHHVIRTDGESDALIGGLVRGYANLAILTEYQWSIAPAIFQARALLYAERLMSQSPDAPVSRQHRAYALALVGMHKAALDELDTLNAGGRPPDAKVIPPWWLEPLDAFLHFDEGRLNAAIKVDDRPWTRFFKFLVIEEPGITQRTLAAAAEILRIEPECYRVVESLCDMNTLELMRVATANWGRTLETHLAERILAMPDLPRTTHEAISKDDRTEKTIYTSLRSAGDAASDKGAPSWSALATVVENTRFSQAWNALYYQSIMLGLPAEEEAKQRVKLLEHHPLCPLMECFTIDRVRNFQGWQARLQDPVGETLDIRARTLLKLLVSTGPENGNAWFKRALSRSGGTFQDTVRYYRYFPLNRWGSRTFTPERISPHSPHATVVSLEKISDPKRLLEIENASRNQPLVQEALAMKHADAQRSNEAIRCFKRRIELSPDGSAYRKLASLYKTLGKDDLWVKTLDESLQAADYGLGHASARRDIAQHYMSRKEFQKAEPYALAAAESHAAWALKCAAECEVALGKWDEANALYKTMAERYEGAGFDWYFMCRKHGKMDVVGAERHLKEYIASLGQPVPVSVAFDTGRFYLLTNQLKKALVEFDRVNDAAPTRMGALFAALTAGSLGNIEDRDRRLAKILELPPKLDDNWEAIAPLSVTIHEMASKRRPSDAAAVAAYLKSLPTDSDRTDAAFFLGWLVATHGENKRATELWKRCLDADENGKGWIKTHARGFHDSLPEEPNPTK